MGFHGDDFLDFAFGIHPDDVEIDEGVVHPEGIFSGVFEDEDHAAVGGHGGAVHEAEHDGGFFIGDIRGDNLGADGKGGLIVFHVDRFSMDAGGGGEDCGEEGGGYGAVEHGKLLK